MTLEQSIIDAVRALPPHKQQELLDHAERLRTDSQREKPLKSVKGLWSDLGISLSAEDIDELRREMWKDYPRSDF